VLILWPVVAATLDLDRHKKPKLFRGPSNDYSWAVWFQLSKWFKRRSALKHFSHRVQLWEKCLKTLPLWNHLDNWNQTAQEWSLEGPLQILCFLYRSEIQDGHHCRK
jgi:hypothetical protein